MKRTLLSLSMVILCTVATLAQNKILKKYADKEHVKTAYYTGSAIKLIANSFLTEQLNLNTIIDNLDNLQILTIDDSDAYKPIAADAAKAFYSKKSYKEILNIIDNDYASEVDKKKSVEFNRHTLLAKKISGTKSQYVLIHDNNDDHEILISIIEGTLTPEEAGIIWRNAHILLNEKIELQSLDINNTPFISNWPQINKIFSDKSNIESVTYVEYSDSDNEVIEELNKATRQLFTPTFEGFSATMTMLDGNDSQWIFSQPIGNDRYKHLVALFDGSTTILTIFIGSQP